MKKLSIITICYNAPDLESTCESIVNQTWQDFEWIVIDGGSDEEIQKILNKYKYRIDKFVSEPDKGIYNACNKGIKLATGEYLNFMNAGDSFFTKDILKLFNCFSENNKADVFYGAVEVLFKNKQKRDFITQFPKNISLDFYALKNTNTQGMFIRKTLFEKFGMFEERYKIAADYAKWIEFLKSGVSFIYIPIIIASYDGNGISSDKEHRSLALKERNEIIYKYFSKKEIAKTDSILKKNYTFYERLFSLKNSPCRLYKIITFCGIHIKIKRKRK